MNPRARLAHLLATLPDYPTNPEQELEGRLALPSGTRLANDDYTLGELIGCGSFGLIYSATDSRIGQSLAIKEFFPNGCKRTESNWEVQAPDDNEVDLPQLRAQFKEEFRVLERFERPGIVKVYDLFTDRGGLFLVMEQLEGATLDEVVKTLGNLEEPLALWIIRRLIKTLETIHLSGLIHGDIKPENLFLTRQGQVILLDFGAVNHYLTDTSHSNPRFLTPGYAPPEQYHADSIPDPASDLYAVGATLYELLTGTPPPDAIERTKGARLVAPSRKGVNISQSTVSVLGRTLALAREKRPASAHTLLGLLPVPTDQEPMMAPRWTVSTPWLGHKQGIIRLQLTSNGDYLASIDKGGHLRLWSVEAARCLGVVDFDRETSDLALHPENVWLAVALAGGQVELLEFHSGKSLGTLRDGTPTVSKLAFTPDGMTLVCGLYDGRVEIRSLKPNGQKKIIRAHDGTINDIDFSPSGRLMSLGSNDRSASVWDLRTGRRVRSFHEHNRPVHVARFSPTGQFLITGGSDMSLRVFDVKRGDEFRRLKGHEAMVWDLHFLNEQTLLTCSADRTIRGWDMMKFRETDQLLLSEAWLRSIAYSRSTSTLFVAGMDKAIHRIKVNEETSS